jgi:hypothetical protein
MYITEVEIEEVEKETCLKRKRPNPFRNIEYRSITKQFAVVFSYEKNGKKMESILGVFSSLDEAIAARDKSFAKRSEVPSEVAA